ncbi:DinB family protein [Intrasporangium sp. YIM S08009]|uniref:DinB family protein n=1 Tax=Intrasporangium zincisolvens TaxID=3080018 RepID=UPI002B0584E5|nr:DinB family protein [Intrasporangium sp. YIM S08009]
MTRFPEPASTLDLRGLLLDYLDFYRDVVIGRVEGLDADMLQDSVVPSEWTAAGLLNHLANVERRWMAWGFEAEDLPDPWRDASASERDAGWVSPAVGVQELATRVRRAGADTRRIAEAHELTDRAAVGGRFTDVESAPQLQWVLLHLIQEYARHAGHLDIWRELHDGAVGEVSTAGGDARGLT